MASWLSLCCELRPCAPRVDGDTTSQHKAGDAKGKNHDEHDMVLGDPNPGMRSDGGGGAMVGKTSTRKSISAIQGHTSKASVTGKGRFGTDHEAVGVRNSQANFGDPSQTFVVFDWDDTLFPTYYTFHHLKLDVNRPLANQAQDLGARYGHVKHALAICEQKVDVLLREAKELSHVVILTLASRGWVEMACQCCYPATWALLQELQIPIVYAREHEEGIQQMYNKDDFQSSAEVERYWGLVKGQAIAKEAERFYSQYAGQSWKNILSIGDSCFERYGLLAATSAYMQGEMLDKMPSSHIWNPAQSGCWEKSLEGHVLKMRAKCCKFVDSPDVEELAMQLELMSRWLNSMIMLDSGFDLDLEVLETEHEVANVEDVLRGVVPTSQMPQPRPPAKK